MSEKLLYLLIHSADGSTTELGSWPLTDEKISNFEHQKEIGWHIFQALNKGAVKIETILKSSPDNEILVVPSTTLYNIYK